MLIHEMTEDECRAALKEMDFARLACVCGDQPYIVPVHFSYDGRHLYGITTLGQKIEWMRSNPLVCLETDERTYHDRWVALLCLVAMRSYPIRRSINVRALTLSKLCRAEPCGGSRLVSPLSGGNGVRRSSTGSALNG